MTYGDDFKAVVLGALFHDIGKFYQRADQNIAYKDSDILNADTKRLIERLCPNPSRGYTHKHVLWTFEFFQRQSNHFRKVFKNEMDLREDNVANLASYHHNPSTPMQYIIQQADRLSSGVDRAQSDEEEIKDETGKFRFRFSRLRPIFEEIRLEEHKISQQYKYEMKELSLKRESIFPRKFDDLTPPMGTDLWTEYLKLWESFERELGRITTVNFYYLVDSYLSLVEQFAWCIPSSTNDMLDISLYDHMKTTAAIASCLYRFHEGQQLTKDLVTDRNDQKYLLVGGDLSGIQKYIFDLAHVNLRKVSKTLRGRSFYLTALPKVLITKILLENALTPANSLMETGGRFILLMPNTQRTREYLDKLEKEIGEWCMGEFYGELTVGLDWQVSLSGNDFMEKGFVPKLDQLNRNLEKKKFQKYAFKTATVWEDNEFVMGRDYEEMKDDTTELCRTCNKKPAEVPIKEDGEEIQVCKSCYLQQEIGKALTKSSVFSIQKHPMLQPIEKMKEAAFQFHIGDDVLYFVLHNDKKFDLSSYEGILTAFALEGAEPKAYLPRQFIANYVPRFKENELHQYKEYYGCQGASSEDTSHIQKGQLKTFNDLAIPPNQLIGPQDRRGVPYLAIIKADVDNLGLIFSQGLQANLSISRYATLSRMINTYFCGYLNGFLESNYPNIYTVYAGGDDLFLIGYWADIISFAHQFNKDFREYTCWNEDIHISAGIELVKRRSPIRKGAEMAEESLDEAKKYVSKVGAPKNSFSLFNSTLKWDEWEWLTPWIQFFDQKLEENRLEESRTKINSSFLFRLLKYQQMALAFFDNGKVGELLYLSRLCYDIVRNIEIKQDGVIVNADEIKQLQKLITCTDDQLWRYIHIPIFYALYKHRGGN